MGQVLKAAVARQRVLLSGILSTPMERLAQHCAGLWPDSAALENLLTGQMQTLPCCKYLQARQITANVTAQGRLPEQFVRDRSQRPYLAGALAGKRFTMSDAYLSRNARHPSLTAAQRIENEDGSLKGYLGADFGLHELPPDTRNL
jgi:hypothetical protein